MEIAYTLGIAPSTVTDSSTRAQRKLGLGSWVELAAFFAHNGPRARLVEMSADDEKLLVGSYPLMPERKVKDLTAAEREVLAALLSGVANAEIARRRAVGAG